MQYQLSIAIDSIGLQEIYGAGEGVTVVKNVSSTPASGSPPVSWVNFRPVGADTVVWGGDYFLFATESELFPGAQIEIESTTEGAAQAGWTYTFDMEEEFSGKSGGPADSFNVINKVNGIPYSFGVAQEAVVNQQSALMPLCALPVPPDSNASFVPQEVVTIFLADLTGGGTVLDGIPDGALTVTLTPQSPTAYVGFDDASGNFYLTSETVRHGSHHEHRRVI